MLERLSPAPVEGVRLDHIALLRLDQLGGAASGNKSFKLRPHLEIARREGISRLVSFGGAWSNHLHALAAIGAERGLATVGIVRAQPHEAETATLADARRWGMHVERVGRGEYRRRADPDYLEKLRARFAPCLVIPEGGTGVDAANACRDIVVLLQREAATAEIVVVPVGTGTTLAGVIAAASAPLEVLGISALKGVTDLDSQVETLLSQMHAKPQVRWRIDHDYHCGGFARVNPELKAFLLAFERVQGYSTGSGLHRQSDVCLAAHDCRGPVGCRSACCASAHRWPAGAQGF